MYTFWESPIVKVDDFFTEESSLRTELSGVEEAF